MPFVKVAVTDAPAGLTSAFAAETFGSGFGVWGAGMGFDFNNVGGVKSAYDGAKYKGITFWAKAGSQGDATGPERPLQRCSTPTPRPRAASAIRRRPWRTSATMRSAPA